MVKGQQKTRKAKKVVTVPQLRKAFNHMDNVVDKLRNVAKHSFSDAVKKYRDEWRKTFKHDLSPAEATTYLKFRFKMKADKTRRVRTQSMRGGAAVGSMGGAPLDYSLRAGTSGVYGNFPTYQTQGLDRSYTSAIMADCGKPNGFPTDGSAASQAGGGIDGLFRPILPGASASSAYSMMMTDPGKGTAAYPSSDPTGRPELVPTPPPFIPASNFQSDIRSISQVSHPLKL
jgi:hypothetical protein